MTIPSRACRPFDFERDGTIVGEGAAAFVVESYAHAVRRGADIYAEILGVGAGCDGTGYANGAGGTGLVCAMRSALNRAGIQPSELGHINAHGKSTQRDDLVEARAYHRALGAAAETIPVTALKSYFGHFDAGSGAVELAGSVLALKHGLLPATLNYETPDPRCRLNVVHGEPQSLKTRTAIKVNRTAMGQSRRHDHPRGLVPLNADYRFCRVPLLRRRRLNSVVFLTTTSPRARRRREGNKDERALRRKN